MGKISGRRVKDDYLELVKAFPLKNIRNERQHDEAIRVLARLDGRVVPLTHGEREYADALASLIRDYEHGRPPHSLPKVSGVEFVRHLLAEHGLTQKEFGKLIDVSESAASMILAGQRDLTKSHILRLAEYFGLPAAAFL